AALTVYGILHLRSVTLASRAGDTDTTRAHVAAARDLAPRLGGPDPVHYALTFGPANVTTHETAAHVQLGDAAAALAAREPLHPPRLAGGVAAGTPDRAAANPPAPDGARHHRRAGQPAPTIQSRVGQLRRVARPQPLEQPCQDPRMATSRVLAASIEWGTVGEWFGAIGAIGAGAIALWIAIRDGRDRDPERRAAEAAQARGVIATVQHDREPRNLAGERNLRVRVANHSNAPITSIDILEITPVESWKIGRQPGRVGEFFAAAIPPGGETVSEPVELTGLPLIAESLPIERAV